MPELRESVTAVLMRAETVADGQSTEPYEAGWAGEAVVFAQTVEGEAVGELKVQVSADGMVWVDEGTRLPVPAQGAGTFARITHFGNWLRFLVALPDGKTGRLTITLHLKA